VLALTSRALCWLIVASLLGVIASIKLHGPGFLANWSWLTYGRVQPAAWNAFVYGFLCQAGLAVGLWITCRLSGTPLLGRGTMVVATDFWNLGLLVGVVGILAGDSTGVETLEAPAYAAPILLAAYLGLAAWIVVTFHHRRERTVFISQWYVLGAVFAFPWLYAAANLGAVIAPLRGVLSAAVQAWYAHNLFTLWFTFLGLAVLYYFLPKLTGLPVPSRALALFGFWSLALFSSFGGLQRYAGGPFPAYMISTSVVAGVLSLLPLLAVVLNLWPLVRGQWPKVRSVPAWWFITFAGGAFVVASLLGFASAFGWFRRATHFTLFTLATEQLSLRGFFALGLIGALYYLVPRVVQRDWPSTRLIRLHFVCAAVGVVLSVLALGVGGILHGSALNDPAAPFLAIVKVCVPFEGMATLANTVLLVGDLALVTNMGWLLFGCCRDRCLPVFRDWLRPPWAPTETPP